VKLHFHIDTSFALLECLFVRPVYPVLIGLSLAAVLLSGCNTGAFRAALIGEKESRLETAPYTHEGIPGQTFSVTVGKVTEEGVARCTFKDFEKDRTQGAAAYAAFLVLKANKGLVEAQPCAAIPPVTEAVTDDETRAAFEALLIQAKQELGIE
jgi:hypothetical protein